jgi:hypothetical protein
VNLSLVPVLDCAKEPLISIWRELIDRVGMTIAAMEARAATARRILPPALGTFPQASSCRE